MKRLIILTLLLTAFATTWIGCSRKPKYFEPTGINDRTKELAGKNVWTYLNNKESIDEYTRVGDSIFGGEIACNVKPLTGIDIKTFKALAGTNYAKDTSHVYYPLEIPCIDYTDCGVCYYGKIIIENANPISFRYLGKDYASDGKYVFVRGELLQGADGATFKIVEGPQYFCFATDKNNVYKRNRIFKEADPLTFYYNKNDPRNKVVQYEAPYIIGDKNNEWEYDPLTDQFKKVDKK